MRLLMLLPTIVLLAAAGVNAQSRYLTHTTRGEQRVCAYEKVVADPGDDRVVTRVVGSAEPCPPTLRDLEETVAAGHIPSMARLTSHSRTSNQLVCLYSYLGQEYRKVLRVSERCPLTPHFGPSQGTEDISAGELAGF